MPKKRKPITSVSELLKRMFIPLFGTRKYKTEIKIFVAGEPILVEYSDDGKGHSGAFSERRTDVDQKVFEECIEKSYLKGRLMPGYVSKTNFELSETGKEFLTDLFEEERKKRKK